MNPKRDYYEVLGLQRGAQKDEIKKAYKRLAGKYHPDRNEDKKGAEDKFKEVQEAYSVLADDQKRAAYDQFGHAANGAGGHGGGFGGFGGGFGDIFDDIFGGDIFGGGRRARRPAKGRDRELSIDLTLEEVAEGVIRYVRIQTRETCGKCKGSGRSLHTETALCPTCKGSGRSTSNRGAFILQRTCQTCGGEGHITHSPCEECAGEGVTATKQELAVTIPAGVEKGDLIRLSGRGDAGTLGGPHGDLYIRVNQIPHPIFARKGDNLYCDVPVSFPKAALGSSVEIPTLKGTTTIDIPPETQNGDLIVADGEGLKGHRARRKGDLRCRIVVETPVNLNAEQVGLLKQFEESLEENQERHSPESSRSWFEKVKDLFD